MAHGIHGFLNPLRRFPSDLLDFVYPPLCGICGHRLGSGQRNVCQVCWRSLPAIVKPYCDRCGIPMEATGTICASCHARQHHFSFSRSYGLFDDHFQTIIHLFKYRRRRSLAKPLAELMVVTMKSDQRYASMDALIPVPLHSAKARARGFNQSQLLAERLSQISGLELLTKVLIRQVNTRSQFALGLGDRMINVRGAFRVMARERVHLRGIILLDDVLTTGATADACAEVLLKAGAAEVCVLTIARASEPETSD